MEYEYEYDYIRTSSSESSSISIISVFKCAFLAAHAVTAQTFFLRIFFFSYTLCGIHWFQRNIDDDDDTLTTVYHQIQIRYDRFQSTNVL